jgi:hypothetical protein
MASTYVNDLRLNEMATGDASGSWGTVTNTNLELIGEAFSYGTETIGDADSTLTIADGAADAARSFYLKITSSVDLTTTRIVTLAPNTVSKVWMIENATTGSQVITIKQGSGATINVPNGQVKMISTDGAGSGGAVLDLLVDVDLTGTTTLVNLDVSGAVDIAGDLTLSAGGDGALRFTAASSVKVLDNNAAALVFEEADNAYMTFVTTDGSEAVKFDKALDINAATQIDATVTVGVDDTGYDVKFFGATAGAYMLWDESADDLILGGAAGLSVNSAATVGGTLGVTGVVTANAGVVVDNFTLDGTTLALSSGNMSLTAANIILDSSGDIVLDGDGADVLFKDGGTEYLRITNSSSDVIYKNMTGDKDLIFKGIDGAVEITALTLDMSAAGAATFNTSVLLSGTGGLTTTGGNNLTVSGSVLNHAGLIFATQAILPAQEGAEAAANVIDIGANGNEFKSLYLNTSIINDSGFTIDSGGDITFDAAGADIFFGAIGNVGSINMAANNLTLSSLVSDADMLFKGSDGGSTITALTLDMSDAGSATFNKDIFLPDAGRLYFTSTSGFSPRISNATTTTTMSFFTNNTERMSIDSGGDVTVKTGNLVIGTAGKGIDFSAVTGGAGTATGNVLSDYEEGTFIPVLRDAYAGNAAGTSLETGRYTKIGRVVNFSFAMQINSLSGMTAGNSINITGLPYTVNNASAGGGEPHAQILSYISDLASADYSGSIILRPNNNTTSCELKYTAAGAVTSQGVTSLKVQDISATTYLTGAATYETT